MNEFTQICREENAEHHEAALKKYVQDCDIAVAKDGSGLFFDLQEAVESVPADKPTTIYVGEGEWVKPSVPSDKKIRFVLRDGARWVR